MPKVDTVGRVWMTTRELQDVMFGGHIPESEKWRRYYGKAVNTAVIEQVLINASQGFMRDLADLGGEVLRTDPHLAGIVTKRMRAVGSVRPQVTPATGPGLDESVAKHWADVVRAQLLSIPRLRQRQVSMAWSAWNARAALEIEWRETRNPKERWRAVDLHWIHPRRISLGPERELRINDSLFQGAGFEPIGFDMREIPYKFITSRRQLFNEYPEREGLCIPALFFSYFKRLTYRERMALLELYGKPHRWIEVQENATVDDTALDKARDTADDMGGDTAAALPAGTLLKVQQLAQGSNMLPKEIIEDVNAELSKLVLGQVNTTDSKPGGLGSGQANVHQDGETLVFTTDCDETAEDWTEGFARAVVQLNGGPDAAEFYTPKVELSYEAPPDPEKVLTRAKAMLDIGAALKKSELYEQSGFSQPTDEDEEGDILRPSAPAPANPYEGLFSVNPSDTSDQGKELDEKPEEPKRMFLDWRPGRVRLSAGTTVEINYQGIPIIIDRPRGFVQQGVSSQGEPWERIYTHDYGFIPNTQGGDGEGLDVFLGSRRDIDQVYWVKQKRADGTFDEYKCFLGFETATGALDCYGAHIPTEFFAGIESTTVDQMKALLGLEPAPLIAASAAASALRITRARSILGLIAALES